MDSREVHRRMDIGTADLEIDTWLNQAGSGENDGQIGVCEADL
jgi:hypothetical protein